MGSHGSFLTVDREKIHQVGRCAWHSTTGGFTLLIINKKLRTAFRVFRRGGPIAVWSVFTTRVGEASRTMPGGLLRVGTCFFRATDEESRNALVKGTYEAPERFATKRFIRLDI